MSARPATDQRCKWMPRGGRSMLAHSGQSPQCSSATSANPMAMIASTILTMRALGGFRAQREARISQMRLFMCPFL